jgi:hypothetical protein
MKVPRASRMPAAESNCSVAGTALAATGGLVDRRQAGSYKLFQQAGSCKLFQGERFGRLEITVGMF